MKASYTKRPQNMSPCENIEWVMNNELEYEPDDWEKNCWIARKGRCSGKEGRPQYFWKGKTWLMYRLIWCQWNDCDFPEGLAARHLCGNPSCINPTHIKPGTAAENEADKPKKTQEEMLSYLSKLPVTPSNITMEEKVDFWLENHTRDEGDCKIWLGGTGTDGYGRRNVTIDGERKKIEAHRWIYCVKNNIPYGGSWVSRHTCNNRTCVNPEHIIKGTRSENTRDARKYSKATKLTEKQVRHIIGEIRATNKWEMGDKIKFQRKYAEAYEVSIDAIHNIMSKRNWKDIWEEYPDHEYIMLQRVKKLNKRKQLSNDDRENILEGFEGDIEKHTQKVFNYLKDKNYDISVEYIRRLIIKSVGGTGRYLKKSEIHQLCAEAEKLDLTCVLTYKNFINSSAIKYNRTKTSISHIVLGKYWTEVSSKYSISVCKALQGSGSVKLRKQQIIEVIEASLDHKFRFVGAFDKHWAEKFGVNPHTIRRIRLRESWPEIWEEYEGS